MEFKYLNHVKIVSDFYLGQEGIVVDKIKGVEGEWEDQYQVEMAGKTEWFKDSQLELSK